MHDISDFNNEGLPSSASLIKATLIALVIGLFVLVTTVLPAEYGIDLTGLGHQMGLTALNSANADETMEAPSDNLLLGGASMSPVWKSPKNFRTDSLTVTLQPDEGTEIKAVMKEGERLVFSWSTQGGGVNFDMHGEPPGKPDSFTSYWKGLNQPGAHGEFVAPFEGTHGWYWRNRNLEPVTIILSTSGFYEKLYQP
jgi:hypothetical protein